MNWYLAKMVFQIICGEGNHRPQFDEQLRLLQAGSREEALHKAQLLGIREQESFFNRQQQLVQWQFVNTSELYMLHDLVDGAELYSRVEEPDDATNYMHVIRNRAEQLAIGQTHEILNIA